MNEDKPRRLVYVEKHTKPSQIFSGNDVWYECPECGRRYTWESRTYGEHGRPDRFCRGCGNWMSWAKLDYENYKETDTGFDKKMPFWKFLQNPLYGHHWEEDVSMTYSHSEKHILEGCISLMHELTDAFSEYLEFMGWEPDEEDDEQEFTCRFTYGEIVRRLFLWHTSHSGGTSTGMKCRNLGVDYSGTVTFSTQDKENDDD